MLHALNPMSHTGAAIQRHALSLASSSDAPPTWVAATGAADDPATQAPIQLVNVFADAGGAKPPSVRASMRPWKCDE
jgi:hypothetical protein